MPSQQLGGAPNCKVCGERVYYSEQKLFMSLAWHVKCFKCKECKKTLDNSTANVSEEDDSLTCNQCQRKSRAPPAPLAAAQGYTNRDDPECCPRCGRRVYFAEQTLLLGRKWHKTCFNCAACSKRLEVTGASDHDGDIFCKTCYARNFGPRGYGFASGAGLGLSTSDGASADNPGAPHTAEAYNAPLVRQFKKLDLGDNNGAEGGASAAKPPSGPDMCPRCDIRVYIAERRAAAGKSYHEKCFCCNECGKKLDLGSFTERSGEVYCKVCYGRQFGPKGYGYSGLGVLLSP